MSRRPAVIILTAGRGDVAAARGLVSDAIRKVLRVRRWHESPHLVCYNGKASDFCSGDASYSLDVTDEEMAALLAEINAAAERAGWTSAPVEVYHD